MPPAIPQTLRPYQSQAILEARESLRIHRRVLIVAPTGAGKCLGKGTPVLMADGSIKPVEEITIGEDVMGPDSLPRLVTSICTGTERMYRITPKKGIAWTCNESHILSLISNHTDCGLVKGGVYNISVREYLELNRTKKHILKLYRRGVNFKPREVPIDPYFLGVWLGDGHAASARITNIEPELTEYLKAFAEANGCTCKLYQDTRSKAVIHSITGKRGGDQSKNQSVHRRLDRLGVLNNKHIPQEYLMNDRATRLSLLAGLLDTDGHLTKNYYEISTVSKRLSDDIVYLCRSLGMAAYVAKATNKYSLAYRVTISGHLQEIPCIVPRKQAKARGQIKDVLNVGFSVEDIGIGEYFGFTLSGTDRLFMLGDFTVTHNTTIAADIIRRTVERGGRVWFLAHRKELIDQASARLDQFGIAHGVIMAQHWRDRPHERVQVASVQTLVNRDVDVPPTLIIIDEAHRATAASYQTVIENAGKPRVIGLTATPIRGDGKGLASMFDAMVQCPPIRQLMDDGYLVPARAFAGKRVDLAGVEIRGSDYDPTQLNDAMNKPHLVGDVVTEWRRLASGRPTMVFAAGVKHSRTIVDAFLAAGIKAAHLDGETPKAERELILKRLADGRLTVVSNAMVLTEGVDVPVVSAVVLARPTKSKGLYLQMAGRGLRTAPGKTDCLILDHGNCTMEHGLVDRDQNWQLTDDSQRKRGKQVSYAETFKVCPDCGEVAELQADACPCGYKFAVRSKQKELKVYNGVLEEVTEKRVREYSEAQRKAKYFRLLYDQHTGTKKDGSPFSKGYAFVKYEGIFKQRPESGWRAEWNDRNPKLIADYAEAWAEWLRSQEPQSCTCHIGHPPCGWCTSPRRNESDFSSGDAHV